MRVVYLAILSLIAFTNVYADDVQSNVECTLTNVLTEDGKALGSVSSFSPADTIHLICTSTDAKIGQVIKATYSADSVPSGTTSSTVKSATVGEDATSDKPFIVDLIPGMPSGMKSYPEGSYNVEISVNGSVIQTIPFSIS